MKKIEVAVLDSKINDLYTAELFYSKFTSEAHDMYDLHGTLCYLIIKQTSNRLIVSNYEILTENERGKVEDLELALKWCADKKIHLANLSFGSNHFLDSPQIKKVVNYYVNKGMIIVVATSNDFFSSYPAKFSSVIGVAQNHLRYQDEALLSHIGVDILAPSKHKINVFETQIETEMCNSYAAPYICSMVGTLFQKHGILTIKQTKKMLLQNEFHEPYVPDWISNAYIYGKRPTSKAKFYFQEVSDPSQADTIIVCEGAKVGTNDFIGKHCVNLTEERINSFDDNYFFWTSQNRTHQIEKANPAEHDFDIPVISLTIPELEDSLELLFQLKNLFAKERYNAYVASSEKSCVLYDIEFLPVLENRDTPQIKYFLYWETYYNQSDILLISNYKEVTEKYIPTDIDIIIKKESSGYDIEITENDQHHKSTLKKICLDQTAIKEIYQQLLLLLQ